MKKIIKIIFPLIICMLLFIAISFTQNKIMPDDFNINEVPYISTYYINPVVNQKENVIINYYISDYTHKEYVSEDFSDIFAITVKVEGKKDIIKKRLKAGNHSINLGKFNKPGEYKFSILATDQYGRNSHELFNTFLVKNKTAINEYIMTENDLANYNIDNTNNIDNTSSTRNGLQQLLDDKSKEGYNKLTLLPGTYRTDHESPIYIPTEFTLNLNQSTIKLNGFTGDKVTMIELNNTFDSHVVNGIIEGDYYEHDYQNSPNNSEWVNGVKIGGESKYSSFENLIVKDITGYGGTNGIANSRDGELGYTYLPPTKIGDTFKLGDVDITSGESIESSDRTTSDFIDIDGYGDIGYLSISRYLGYQGNPANSWNLIAHFYDKDKNYIESIDGYQYRKIGVPSDAKYVKVTLLDTATPTDLSIQYFRVPTNCSFKNVKFENCRAVGLAQEAMNNMLVENCEFTKSGQALAKCAYDAEDGWDMMQDVTFRSLKFYDNPYNNFLTAAGHNFIIEDSDMSIYIWGRTRNIVIKNSNINGTRIHNDGLVKSGIPRFINNTVDNSLVFANTEDANYYSIVRDCSFKGGLLNGIANNCIFEIPEGYLENVTINNSEIKNMGTYLNDNVSFNNCVFSSDKSSYLKFNLVDGNRIFDNCTFKDKTELTGNYFNKAIFNNSAFEDVNINVNTANKSNDLQFNNCDISYSNDNLLNISSDTNVNFNNCKITDNPNTTSSLVYLQKEPSSGAVIFKDCNINKSNGFVLDGYYTPGSVNPNANYEVKFKNTKSTLNSFSEKYLSNKYYNIN